MICQIYPNRQPRGFPRYMPSIMQSIYQNKEPITAPVFGDSSGDPNGSTSDNPNKYPYTVPIIKKTSATSANPTKDNSHYTKELPSAKEIKIPIESTSEYPTGDLRTMTTDQKRSDPDYFNQGRKEAQVSLQGIIIMSNLHII